MSPMIPDCGVLTTPRRSPSINLNAGASFSSPKVASPVYVSPSRRSEEVGVTLSTGFSFSFYKSPKLPVRRAEPQPVRQHVGKNRRDNINKGVGHKIKKPKVKSKEQKKKKRNVKTVFKTLKQGNFTPCPWTPENRSPLKKASSCGKKTHHVLSSPGISLLEEDTSLDEEAKGTSKKFFTSRSRASATVNINKNVLLAAKKGDIVLTQRDGPFVKKNVGRVVEEQLEKFINSNPSESLPALSSLPSVKANPRPKPTRVPMTPSPPKLMASPRKPKKLFNPKQLVMGLNSTQSFDANNTSSLANGGSPQKSPRKMSSPRKSPRKQDWSPSRVQASQRVSSPVKKSPRKVPSSPSRTPNKRSLTTSPKRTPTSLFRSKDSRATRSSPRKNTPTKTASNETPKRSPRKKLIEEDKENDALSANSINGLEDSDAASELPKLFPVFDRHQWKSGTSSPTTTEKACVKLPPWGTKKSSSSQMIIDAGQKEYGIRQCTDCGVVYEIANKEDETAHLHHHNTINSSLKFMGWKKETMVRDFDEFGGRIIMITSEDPSFCWRKVEEVLKVVDEELGFSESGIQVKENTRVFLYVLERKIVGCLIAEKVKKANRVMPTTSQSPTGTLLLCCSEEQFSVWAGVSRIWVLNSHRGKGIATKLSDAMRCNMINTHILSKDEIAFSDPTEKGAKFAEKYCGKRNFLVYRR